MHIRPLKGFINVSPVAQGVTPRATSSVIEVIKEVQVEVIKEVRVEVPVYIEKVVEKPVVLHRVEYQDVKVPYEVIKEVVVEKIVEVQVPTIHEVTRIEYKDRTVEVTKNSKWLLVLLVLESLVVLGLFIKQIR